MRPITYLAHLAALASLASSLAAAEPLGERKICIGHAGASGYAPEHTRSAYRLAVEMKADYIEQDLQLTKDGVLVCIHDDTLDRTTNVEDVFPERYRTMAESPAKKVWPVYDFTLDEIKQLDAGNWFDPKFAGERVLTFAESIEIAGQTAGIYPELKKSQFLPLDGPRIVEAFHRELSRSRVLQRAGSKSAVIVQSFHPEMLKSLRVLSNHAYALVQLIWFTQVKDLLSDEGLSEVAKYADGIGPVASMLLEDRSRVAAAHTRGLRVHVWFLDKSLPGQFASQSQLDTFLLYECGVDGLFCDRPDQFPRRGAN